MESMNRLSIAERVRVVSALVEGCGINAITRMVGTSKPTVLKLLADLGQVCLAYHDRRVRGLHSKRIECDEIWSFVGAKQKNVREEKMADGWGDVWTWTALDADSKLMVSYMVGQRGADWAKSLYEGCSSIALTTRVQLTTDGYKAYVNAIEGAFGFDVDYAMLIKLYGNPAKRTRYSPGEVIGQRRAYHGRSRPQAH